jgi:hypothetical protein
MIETMIPNSASLIIKIRINDSLGKPLEAWCRKQGFSKEMTDSVFLTWRGSKLFNTTTIQRLGVSVDPKDPTIMHVQGDHNVYTDQDPPKILLRAFTEPLYQTWKKQEALKEQQRDAIDLDEENDNEAPPPEPEPETRKTKIVMKAKGKDDFKLNVNPVGLLSTANNAWMILTR